MKRSSRGTLIRRPTSVFDVDSVLHATLLVLKETGKFVSNKTSLDTGETPTSKFVIQKLKSIMNTKFIVPEFEEKVKQIKEHFLSLPAHGDDFMNQVKEILLTGSVTEKRVSIVVYLPYMFEKKENRINELSKIAEKYSNSNYIGEIGTREEFFVKLISIYNFEKDGEKLVLYKVVDKQGNYGFFFSKDGSLKDQDGKPIIDLYDCFVMKATPKKHEIGKSGIKETQFSRVRIIQNVGKGSKE